MSAAARDHASGLAAPQRSTDPGCDVDLDALEAREAAPSEGARSSSQHPGRWSRAAVTTVVLAVVVGAALGAWVADRRAAALARDERAALTVQAGLPFLVRGADPGTADAQGRSPVTVAVPLFNRGPDDVAVTVLGIDAPHQRLAAVPPPVDVPGGTSLPALVDLDVDCAEHLLLSSSAPAPSPSQVRARVELPTGPREVALLLAEAPRMGVADLLTQACTPAVGRRPAQEARWVPRSDGRLVVTVSNVLRTTSVDVDLRQTPGLGVTSDPPLPVVVPALGSEEVTLTLEPDCAVVGSTASGRSSGTFNLFTVAGGVVQTSLADDEDSGREVWLARQLALRCG